MSDITKGEDYYYKSLKDKNNNFKPIQLGEFTFSELSDELFINTINKIRPKVIEFINHNWSDIDDIIFDELDNLNQWNQELIDSTKVIIFRYYVPTKKIYLAINHAVVGGSYYILLAAIIFEGKTNTLLEEPTFNSIFEYLFIQYYKFKFFCFILINIYLKTPVLLRRKEELISYQIETNKLNKKLGTKYSLIYNILNNIMLSLPDYKDNLVCWLPMGFENSENSPKNNIGIIPFIFRRNMKEQDLKDTLINNRFYSLGSREFLLNSHNCIPYSVDIENRIKRNIDVVITLGNILLDDDNCIGYNLTNSNGGMYNKMNDEYGYSIYVWGFTINNKSYLTYSINNKDIDISKLIELTNGKNVTKRDIFKYSKL